MLANQATPTMHAERMRRAHVLAESSSYAGSLLSNAHIQRAIRSFAREGKVHPGKAEDSRYAWISPSGQVFPVPYVGHATMARLIVGSTERAVDSLEMEGWVHLSSDAEFYGRGRPSSKAVDALFDVCATHGRMGVFENFTRVHLD
jgi:hypothetical protein